MRKGEDVGYRGKEERKNEVFEYSGLMIMMMMERDNDAGYVWVVKCEMRKYASGGETQ